MPGYSKNRLFSRLVKQFNEDLTIKTESLEASTRNSISGSLDSAAVTSLISVNALDSAAVTSLISANASGAIESVSQITSLTLDSNEVGDIKYVENANKLFIWSGSAWQNISLSNQALTLNYGGEGSYQLAEDGTPTVITLDATDPEGIPITWSYSVTSGSVGQIATITQADNVFTITPTTNQSYQGSFQLTFTGTDGDNTVTAVNNFQLVFEADPGEFILESGSSSSNSQTWTVPDGVTSVSVVLVGGGGGGAWQSQTYTTNSEASSFGVPGDSFYFYAGGGGTANNTTRGNGGSRGGAYDGGGNGGNGANGSGALRASAGGAGGYSGNGGTGAGWTVAPATSGGHGGGVGIYGEGSNGPAGYNGNNYGGTPTAGSGGGGGGGGSYPNGVYNGATIDGGAGSGGYSTNPNSTPANKKYGGGGAGGSNDNTKGGAGGGGAALAYKNNISVTPGQQIQITAGKPGGSFSYTRGGQGAVRIVWGDSTITRTFPTTNVGPTANLP